LGFARGDTLTVKLRSWWEKYKQLLIIVGIVIIILLIAFVLAVYLFGWDWTGFTLSIFPESVNQTAECGFKGNPTPAVMLNGTDLSYANLSGVNLNAAKLDNAILVGANLTGANLLAV
jgi:hypothetical protein